MDESTEHPWERARLGRRDGRKAKPVLTPKQADDLARSIERLEQRRSYNAIGGVEEEFGW